MEKDVWRQYLSSSRLIMSPQLLVPMAVAAMAIILISGIIEYHTRKSNAEQLLAMQAGSMVEALLVSAEKTLAAADLMQSEISRRMLTNLALLARLDDRGAITPDQMADLRREAAFNQLVLFDADGRRSRLSGGADMTGAMADVAADVVEAINNGLIDRVTVLVPDPQGLQGDALVGAMQRRGGGVLLAGVDAGQLQEIRRAFGLGNLLQDLQKGNQVEYLVLQNAEAIIAGSMGEYTLSAFGDDPFLETLLGAADIRTRTLEVPGGRVLEAAAPFLVNGEAVALLRLGLSLDRFDAMNAQSLRQLAVTGVLTLILGVALLNFIVGHQHRQILRKGFLRLRRYTNTILENLGSGVLAVTPDGMIEVCNREAARLLRTTADQSIGQPVRDLSPDIARLVADTVKQRGGITPARRFAQDGSAETWAIQTSFLGDTGHNGEEREDACIVIVDDVTAQVRLEGQVRRQEKLAAMGTLASTVAHEIRNPLNAIGIIAQLLDRRYSPQETELKYRDYFTSVTREIARINDIVEQFIRFARPPKLDLQPIDFPGLLRDIENLYRETFTGANIRWRVTADPHQATEADASKIKQVVINLVKNAWEAIHEDGEITVTGRAGDDDYTIIVTDNGEGMDAETRSRIFDIYYTKKKDGTGIGLALVHQIVSQHGGTITVDSTPGQGTTCTLRFPCQRVAEVI